MSKKHLNEDGEFLVKGVEPPKSKEPKNVKSDGVKDADKEFTGNKTSPQKDVKHTDGKEGSGDSEQEFTGNKKDPGMKHDARDKEGAAGADTDYLAKAREKVRKAFGLPTEINKINKGNEGLNK